MTEDIPPVDVAKQATETYPNPAGVGLMDLLDGPTGRNCPAGFSPVWPYYRQRLKTVWKNYSADQMAMYLWRDWCWEERPGVFPRRFLFWRPPPCPPKTLEDRYRGRPGIYEPPSSAESDYQEYADGWGSDTIVAEDRRERNWQQLRRILARRGTAEEWDWCRAEPKKTPAPKTA